MSDSGSDISDTADDLPEFTGPPPNRGRRTSVSAESMNPSELNKPAEKVVIPKSDEQATRITSAVKNNFLFKQLDEEQYKEVVDAMGEKRVVAGDIVIQQGDIGDFFYIVESGDLSVYINIPGNTEKSPADHDKWGKKVLSYGAGGSFGELALMYNSPRAATVMADSECILWALDRVTFRRILMDSTFRKRRMYESFLEEVPLLSSLEVYERSKIADALESNVYDDGDVVIKQGDQGDSFYIIESGEATIKQVDDQGEEHTFPSLKKGAYFGELSLLSDKPRAATIIASGKLKCASLNKKAFDRLLGPALDIIKRNTSNYTALTRRKSVQDLIEKMEKDVAVS